MEDSAHLGCFLPDISLLGQDELAAAEQNPNVNGLLNFVWKNIVQFLDCYDTHPNIDFF